MSWSWRYKTLEANSKSPPWGRWECQPTRWWEPFWDPNTRARWTSEPTSSLWRRRMSNKTRYQNCQTFDLSSLMVSKPPSVFPVWMKSFSGIKSVFIQNFCFFLLQVLTTEVGDWRKNVEAMSGMEGRKKMFDTGSGAQWECCRWMMLISSELESGSCLDRNMKYLSEG